MTFNKGDRGVLAASGRIFEVIDERKDERSEFFELCRFYDDPRHPVWIEHAHLCGLGVCRTLTEEELKSVTNGRAG